MKSRFLVIILKEKNKSNLQDMNHSRDHEQFDILHADFIQSKQKSSLGDLLQLRLKEKLIEKSKTLEKVHEGKKAKQKDLVLKATTTSDDYKGKAAIGYKRA